MKEEETAKIFRSSSFELQKNLWQKEEFYSQNLRLNSHNSEGLNLIIR
jgi:hypothetical protein